MSPEQEPTASSGAGMFEAETRLMLFESRDPHVAEWIVIFPTIEQHLRSAHVAARVGRLSCAKDPGLLQLLGVDTLAIDDMAMRAAIGGVVSAVDACADITARVEGLARPQRDSNGRDRWTLRQLASRNLSLEPLARWSHAAERVMADVYIWRDALMHRECRRKGPDDPRILVTCRDPYSRRRDHGAFVLPDDLDRAVDKGSLAVANWAQAVVDALPAAEHV